MLHLYLKNGKTELYVNINRVEESNNLIGPLFIRITACKMQVYLNWHFVNFLVKATVPHPTAVIALFLGLLSAVLQQKKILQILVKTPQDMKHSTYLARGAKEQATTFCQ